MKNRTLRTRNLIIAVLAAVTAFLTATGCDDSPCSICGTVTISPNNGVAEGTELTATYIGTGELIAYQWKKDGVTVGANSNKYTPTAAGSYTVTAIIIGGYHRGISAPVVVSGCIHEWGSWLITAYPTAAANGVETRTCSL
ncbi:MAG: hypothetical protein FWC22_03315, partial [Treponema sp.]|nr:hypothetical protein [Treponema sp.]